MSTHSRSDHSRYRHRPVVQQTGPVPPISRRRLLELGLVVLPAALLLEACGGGDDTAPRSSGTRPGPSAGGSGTTRPATPACGDAGVTPEQTEGPFFSTGSPERASLRGAGIDGTPLVVSGAVLAT